MKETDYQLLWDTMKAYFATQAGLAKLKDTASVKNVKHIELNNLLQYMENLEKS